MADDRIGHLIKLPMDTIKETVDAEPKVPCTEEEVMSVLHDLCCAVDDESYISPTPTLDNPALSDDFIFDNEDEKLVLKDLTKLNFVGKIKDVGKGAKKRLEKGLPQEYLYVFKYPCKLARRDVQESGINLDNVLIYIKINDRKIPNKKVFIVSFHKNRHQNNNINKIKRIENKS